MTMTTMTGISEYLRADVTPQYLAYASVSASIRDMLLAAAPQDAEVVSCTTCCWRSRERGNCSVKPQSIFNQAALTLPTLSMY